MIEVARSADVGVPPAAVWQALAAFGSISAWAPNVDHSCLLSDLGGGVGAVRRIQTGRTTIVERVTEWDPPVGLAYELEGLPPVVKSATNEWRVEPVGAATRITLTSRVDAGPRPPQQILARIVGRRMAGASEEMLAGLADHVEQREAVL